MPRVASLERSVNRLIDLTVEATRPAWTPHGDRRRRRWVGGCVGCLLAVAGAASDYFGIQIIDEQTGRGVPLVELATVNQVRWVTDSAGCVAFHEPGLMGSPVFFHIRSHGYEHPKDGFGYAGVTLTPVAGKQATVRLRRLNVAERLYRVTGQGLYRDSILLGKSTPLEHPLGMGQVAGQDSVSALVYDGRIHWFWGDTSRMSYPLGHFWMAQATSALPGSGGLDPGEGVNLRYQTDAEGFSRPVCRLGVERGLIWADGFLVVPDLTGRERLVCHYAHMESLATMLGHGLAIYDDEREEFTRLREFELADAWAYPAQAHPIRHRDEGVDYFYLGEVFPNVRVQAEFGDLLEPAKHESWTCLERGDASAGARVSRDDQGRLRYGWKRDTPPVDVATEQRLVAQGQMTLEEAHFLPRDVDSGDPVRMHRGSVSWNAYRQRFILIATQAGGTSHLGEVWYAEARALTGPWRRAKKVVTHDRYSFYNPVHHPFFDQDGGRIIYFEGTYANTFSGNPEATPRYDYNQVMYRLDLADPRLHAARE